MLQLGVEALSFPRRSTVTVHRAWRAYASRLSLCNDTLDRLYPVLPFREGRKKGSPPRSCFVRQRSPPLSRLKASVFDSLFNYTDFRTDLHALSGVSPSLSSCTLVPTFKYRPARIHFSNPPRPCPSLCTPDPAPPTRTKGSQSRFLKLGE